MRLLIPAAAHMSSMTISRQPHGIPVGGQFAPTTHPEPGLTLDPARPLKNPEWHAAVDDLVAGGRTPAEARCTLINVLALQTAKTLLENAKGSLAIGHETNGAMFTIAVSSVRNLPTKIDAAAGDQVKAREAVVAARARLKSAGSLLDGIHPTGRQPILRDTDGILADFEEFLGTDSPATEGQS